jgi:hypothetical protein
MHLRLDVAAALIDVELHAHVAIILQREEEMIGVLDYHRAVLLDVTRKDRSRAFTADMQNRVIHSVGQDQRQSLKALHDLMHVLQDALHGLMFVHHAVEAEAPDRASAER